MENLDITRLRVYVVAPDVTPPYRFTGTCEAGTGKRYGGVTSGATT